VERLEQEDLQHAPRVLAEREEQDAILETYMNALGMLKA
jgi:uncharacterized protein (UPF0335 family)